MQIQISWLIWIYTVCKGRKYPGSAGLGLIWQILAIWFLVYCYNPPHDRGWLLWFQVVVLVLVHLSYVCASVVLPSVFSFLKDKLSKCQWIFTKLVMCFGILEICFGFANGQILSFFDRVTRVCNCHMIVAGFYLFSFLFCIINFYGIPFWWHFHTCTIHLPTIYWPALLNACKTCYLLLVTGDW